MQWVCVMLLILVGAAPSFATTYYVATTGSNSNNGTDITTPKLTIQACVDLMVAGDICYVRGGTYSATGVRFRVSGTAGSPIRLLNYANETPVLSCTGTTVEANSILIMNNSGFRFAIGWIDVEGFEISSCRNGFTLYNVHDAHIKRNHIRNNVNQGVLGNGTRVTFERNIINHNGRFATAPSSFLEHGIYINGTAMVVINNLIYDNIGYGIQLNGSGSSNYDPLKHAGQEFALSDNWIISDNTFAYNTNRAGIVVWGSNCDNTRIENNIFYENSTTTATSGTQGIDFFSSLPTGVTIRNNHFYASSSGGLVSIGSSGSALAVEGVNYTQSGNVVNVSAPAFVNGGSNSLPVSPDFRLTASAPVNIARTNEFLNNGIVGAFKTTPTPTASIHANSVTLTYIPTTAIQIPSSTGVSIGCTGANCPGSPTVGNATKTSGTDTQVAVEINGLASNACVAASQTWTISYDSATGGWTSGDDIGPSPGLHQKLFSFTNLAVTNLCDGTGPGGGIGTPLIVYKFDEGTGTTVTNTGSSGSGDDGTLANGAGWAAGKTGSGVNITGGTQQVQVPHGFGVDLYGNSMTWALAVHVPAGGASATRVDMGTNIDSATEKAYVGAVAGTWRVATNGTGLTAGGASNLAVTEGWNYLTALWNSFTDTVTLCKDGITGTGGATRAYTGGTFVLPSNIVLGQSGTVHPTVTPGIYDDFQLFQSVEDCADLHNDWNIPPVTVGTFGMPSYRFQAVYLPELGGSPTSFGTTINQAKTVVAGGAVALLAEIYCENVSDCEQDSFRWEARQNGVGPYIHIPDMETDTHIWMWGADNNALLNAGATTSRLSAGSCAVTDGVTVLTSLQLPVIDLPQDGCIVLRGIFRLGATASGYYDIRLSQQSGTAFTGTVNPARLTVVAPQASAQ